MTTRSATLLPGGHDVPFAEIEATLARLSRDGRRRRRMPARALTATVVVVGSADRLASAWEALDRLGESAGVRAVLISEGNQAAPHARVGENTVAISGLSPRYLNNAVAALRLSSLPALVWWRGGSTEAMADIADLADRVVLDLDQPGDAWRVAPSLFEKTALTDLRWARLTRWRAVLAHLFDLPQVRSSVPQRLHVEASDPFAARLFAGWLKASLHWNSAVRIDLTQAAPHQDGSPLESVCIDAGSHQVALSVHPDRSCLHAALDGADVSARVVPIGDTSLGALIAEELGVRTRDTAFEQALPAALEIPAWA